MNEPPADAARQDTLDRFFDSVRRASRAVLMLDYDGTLAPFRQQRDAALPYPGVMERLSKIAATGQTRLVLVTGRSVDDLLRLLRPSFAVEIWGTHGAERWIPDGGHTHPTLPTHVQAALHQATYWARLVGYESALEVKAATVALHWRGRSSSWVRGARQNVIAEWERIAKRTGLEMRDFDGGIELRAPGFDKGNAVRRVLEEEKEGVPAAYLGDDLTDEDAFRVLSGHGLTVLVRPEFRPTHAEVWLRPPEELLAFLDTWIETCGTKP